MGVTFSAITCLAFGAMSLVAPEELSRMITPGATGDTFVQLLGAALLGFAAMNWIARGSALGGIYGRSVVMANQTHFMIGALIMVERGVTIGAQQPAYWALTLVYLLGATFFSYLAFFSSGLQGR